MLSLQLRLSFRSLPAELLSLSMRPGMVEPGCAIRPYSRRCSWPRPMPSSPSRHIGRWRATHVQFQLEDSRVRPATLLLHYLSVTAVAPAIWMSFKRSADISATLPNGASTSLICLSLRPSCKSSASACLLKCPLRKSRTDPGTRRADCCAA
jgi:hypothetical protein